MEIRHNNNLPALYNFELFLEFLRVWAGGAAELGEYESRHPRQQVQPLLRRLQQRTGQGNINTIKFGVGADTRGIKGPVRVT